MSVSYEIRTGPGPVYGTTLPSGEMWILPDVLRSWLEEGGLDLDRALEAWREQGFIDADGDDHLAWRVIDNRMVRAVVWRADAPPLMPR